MLIKFNLNSKNKYNRNCSIFCSLIPGKYSQNISKRQIYTLFFVGIFRGGDFPDFQQITFSTKRAHKPNFSLDLPPWRHWYFCNISASRHTRALLPAKAPLLPTPYYIRAPLPRNVKSLDKFCNKKSLSRQKDNKQSELTPSREQQNTSNTTKKQRSDRAQPRPNSPNLPSPTKSNKCDF